VLMDHVTVGEEAKIQNSVIGPNCYVETKAEVTECQLGASVTIEAGMEVSKRKIAGQGGKE